jgi:transposase InsO family protein
VLKAIVREIHSRGMHWTNIYEEVKNMVSSCTECQRHNISKRGYHPLTNVIAHRPFDHVAIDLAGPLTPTEEGYVYLLALTDICTKYIVIRPIKNKQSDTIAKTLISIFGDYGFARVIQSDSGSEFRNSLMYSLSKNLGIDRRYTTSYHPQGNGSAEASVKIALNTLRKIVQSNGIAIY